MRRQKDYSFISKIILFLRSFFPLQIVLTQIKFNLTALLYWVILILIVTDNLGVKYGLPFLFYSPELKGEISWLSFMAIGVAIGGFTIAFNIYSFIKIGTKFPFIATLSKPFYKFCWNNFLIPTLFNAIYIIKLSKFHYIQEYAAVSQIASYIAAYLFGFFAFYFGSFLYFFPTNKDFFKLSGTIYSANNEYEPMSSFLHKKVDWQDATQHSKNLNYIYLTRLYKLRLSRSIEHYDQNILRKVFRKNHINITLFELFIIAAFIIMGLINDVKYFELPAGFSFVLLLTFLLMVISILMSWFSYWAYSILLLLFFGINLLSHHDARFRYESFAYGLDYSKSNNADYASIYSPNDSIKKETFQKDKENIFHILNNWKAKTGERKPKMVLVISSGGGSRSALWSFSVLQFCDYFTDGKLSKHTNLYTGASGGILGSSYYRELLLRRSEDPNFPIYDNKFRDNISKDLLNRLAFTAFSNDLFLRFKSYKVDNYYYTKDRAYAFEQQLHSNTDNFLNKKLKHYALPEYQAQIPMLVFTPTIINDSRRLIVSPQSFSFISDETNYSNQRSYEYIDFQNFFAQNQAEELLFASAIRMSATFPFVLPMVNLPTIPTTQVMDAGFRDNYGGKFVIEYLNSINDWVRKNTSGVVIVQIRDNKKLMSKKDSYNVGFLDRLTLPLFNMTGNLFHTQDFDQEQLFKMSTKSFKYPLDVVTFNLRELDSDRISLSWHLTQQEKNKIINAYFNDANIQELERLKRLLR